MGKIVLIWLIGLELAACGGAQRVASREPEVKRLAVNGTELAYVEDGRGDTVVFVHGAAGDFRTWEGVRPVIAAKAHFVAYSRRYHWPNEWNDDGSRYSVAQHVEDLAAFIRALNVGRVHLVGGSYGGRVAGYMALKYPELLRSVTLSDPGLLTPTSEEGKAALADWQRDLALSSDAAKAGDGNRAAALLFDAVHGEPGAFERTTPERRQRFLDNARTMAPMFAATPAKPVLCEDWRTLKVPVLVMRGESTRAIFRLGDEQLLTCLPTGAAIAVVPSSSHMWYPTNPVGGANTILEFIAGH